LADLIDTNVAPKTSTVFVYLASVVAAVSGLLFGFDIAVINGAIVFLRQQFALSDFQTELAASSLLVGCIPGAMLAGYLSDRFGRRRILIFSAVLFAGSAVGASLPKTLALFAVARFAGGVAIGVASVLAPLYIAEVSPPKIRGRLVSLNQMAIVSGILLAYLVNWLLSFLGPNSWRLMFATAAIPSVFFFVALFFVPESPRWLTKAGREKEAFAVLTRVLGQAEAELEMAEIRETIAAESGSLAQLFQPGLRKALLIGVVLAILQQVTGINTVLFYGAIIFKEQLGNHSNSSAIAANVLVGLVNCLSTIIALWIIDKVGRKALLMFSAAGMAICQIGMAIGFSMRPIPGTPIFALILLCAFSFAVGLGPGVWVVMAEIYPTRIRGRAMSIATVSLWVACVALTMTFLSLVRALGISGTFLIYASMGVTMFLFVWLITPETKGKTLEQIEALWKPHR